MKLAGRFRCLRVRCGLLASFRFTIGKTYKFKYDEEYDNEPQIVSMLPVIYSKETANSSEEYTAKAHCGDGNTEDVLSLLVIRNRHPAGERRAEYYWSPVQSLRERRRRAVHRWEPFRRGNRRLRVVDYQADLAEGQQVLRGDLRIQTAYEEGVDHSDQRRHRHDHGNRCCGYS